MKLSFLLCLLGLMPTYAKPSCDEQRMQQLASDSNIVVVANIIEVGPPPKVWSGLFLFVQRVRYEVKDVLKGQVSKREINVGHYIVKNCLSADSKEARLSPDVFKKGNQLLLFLASDPGKGKYVSLETPAKDNDYVVSDSNCGAVLAEENTLKSIRQTLHGR